MTGSCSSSKTHCVAELSGKGSLVRARATSPDSSGSTKLHTPLINTSQTQWSPPGCGLTKGNILQFPERCQAIPNTGSHRPGTVQQAVVLMSVWSSAHLCLNKVRLCSEGSCSMCLSDILPPYLTALCQFSRNLQKLLVGL